MNPRAKKAKALDGFKIEVEFINGEIRHFDMAPLLNYPVYQPLKERSYFEKIICERGNRAMTERSRH
jgi:hypothetical protein